MARPIEISLNTSEFIKTLRQYEQVSKKDSQEVIQDRAGKLSFELFKQFKKLAPTATELRQLPRTLGHRIKRKFQGATVKQEIRRRISARFAAASGWLPAVRRLTKKGVNLKKKNPMGRVEINLREPSVTIVNSMKEGVAAEHKHKAMQSSINAQVADMQVYIQRKLNQRARQFSAK